MEELRHVLLKLGWVIVKQENTLFNQSIQLRKIDPTVVKTIEELNQKVNLQAQELFDVIKKHTGKEVKIVSEIKY